MKRLASLWRLSFLNELRGRYPTALSVAGQAISEICLLAIYWFTSKAYTPKDIGAQDFFSFILMGEVFLAIPAFLFVNFARQLKQNMYENTWENILVSPWKAWGALSLQVSAALSLECLRIVAHLGFAILVFNFHLSEHFGAALLLLLASLPIFVGLGLGSAGVVLWFGRGDRALASVSAGLSILAGVYFPVSVLPAGIAEFAHAVSPFNVLLEGVRTVLKSGAINNQLWDSSLSLLVSGIPVLFFSLLFFDMACEEYRRHPWSAEAGVP